MAFMVLYEDDSGFAAVLRQWRWAMEIPDDMSHEESVIAQARLYGVRAVAGFLDPVVEEAVRGLLLSRPLSQCRPVEQGCPATPEGDSQEQAG